MRKIYLSCLALIASVAASAQVAVTFNVDMGPIDPTTTTLHIAGNFNDPDEGGSAYAADYNAAYQNWVGNADGIPMTDLDGDFIFTAVLMLNPARYEFKFVNSDGNTWENVSNACSVSVNGNNNRQILVESSDTAYPTVCWESCALCGENAVRFRVDMSTVDADGDGVFGEPLDDIGPGGVHVAGDFQNPTGTDNDWLPGATAMQDWDGDKVWEATYQVANMTNIIFKYINGNDWAFPNESINGACGNADGNRIADITDANTILPVYCWSVCDPCTQPVSVTFKVDMNAACASTADGVFLMGTATNWGSGTLMTDDNADGVWELALNLAPGSYEYKFRIGTGNWEGYGGNRALTVAADAPQVLPAVCFGSADPCGPVYAPASITFQARPGSETIPSGQSMWVMGNFTNPNWQSGALMMSDTDGDGIWTVTVPDVCIQNISYKYVIGLDNTNTGTNWLEESADFSEIGGCGVNNGDFSDNRQVIRNSADPITVCWDFNTCTSCLDINVEENNVVANLSVYPVPADNQLTVNFNSPVAQSMNLNIVNNLGQVVMSEYLGTVAGQKTIVLNTSALATGIYSMTISNGRNTQSKLISIK